jgi:putative methyltransferase (TIGR04325 family)
MMPAVKRILRELTPPVLWRTLKSLRTLGRPREWEYLGDTWEAVVSDPRHKGWDVPEVLEAYKAKWPAFVESLSDTRPFGASAEALRTDLFDLTYHNTLMAYAYVLAKAAWRKKAISLLDWGGGMGHYYLISRALMPEVELDYHCKDVVTLANYGRQLFPHLSFYADEACLSRKFDLVLASSSLHFSPDWTGALTGLAGATAGYLFVTRLPVALTTPSYVFVQRPYQYGYNTEYLSWCINRREFVEMATRGGMELVREFVTGERPEISGAREACEYRAYLFRPIGGSG